MFPRAAGLVPVSPVQGRAVLGPLGLRSGGSGGSGELDRLSDGLTRGYTLAVERLNAAAQRLGADGVVDVRLGRREREAEGARLTDFSASGLSVRRAGTARAGAVFTATWTAAECAAALRAGLAPAAVVLGACAYYAFCGTSAAMVDASPTNREHAAFTDAAHFARHAAQERMRRSAAALGADGVVGVAVELRLHVASVGGQPIGGPGDRTCLCLAVGTAVHRAPAAPGPGPNPDRAVAAGCDGTVPADGQDSVVPGRIAGAGRRTGALGRRDATAATPGERGLQTAAPRNSRYRFPPLRRRPPATGVTARYPPVANRRSHRHPRRCRRRAHTPCPPEAGRCRG